MTLYSLLRSRLRRRLTALQSVRPQGVELVYQVRRTVWLVLLVVLAAALSLLIRTGLPAAYRRQAVTELSMWNHHRHMAGLTQQLVDEFNATIGREHRIRASLRTLGDDAFEVFPDAQARGEGPDLTPIPQGILIPLKQVQSLISTAYPGSRSGRTNGPIGIGLRALRRTRVMSMRSLPRCSTHASFTTATSSEP